MHVVSTKDNSFHKNETEQVLAVLFEYELHDPLCFVHFHGVCVLIQLELILFESKSRPTFGNVYEIVHCR